MARLSSVPPREALQVKTCLACRFTCINRALPNHHTCNLMISLPKTCGSPCLPCPLILRHLIRSDRKTTTYWASGPRSLTVPPAITTPCATSVSATAPVQVPWKQDILARANTFRKERVPKNKGEISLAKNGSRSGSNPQPLTLVRVTIGTANIPQTADISLRHRTNLRESLPVKANLGPWPSFEGDRRRLKKVATTRITTKFLQYLRFPLYLSLQVLRLLHEMVLHLHPPRGPASPR